MPPPTCPNCRAVATVSTTAIELVCTGGPGCQKLPPPPLLDGLGYYTTHGGRLHHMRGNLPGIEEQYTDDSPVHYVAISAEAFKGADYVWPVRHKPGVCRVMARFRYMLLIVYSKDEFLPAGVEIAEC